MRYQQAFEPVPALFSRFTAFVRELDDDEWAAPVPGMDWTAGEVGAHVLTVLQRYLRATERAATRSRLAALNAEDVAAVQRTRSELADDIDRTIGTLAAFAPDVPLDTERDFHLGLTVTMAAAWANLIGELLVHGDDIARATGRHWTVEDDLLEGIWRNLLPAAAGWMRPEARSVDELYRLEFPFGTVHLRLDAGAVRVDDELDAGRTPDHVITVADAAGFTLQFPYGRARIDDPITALLASRFVDI